MPKRRKSKPSEGKQRNPEKVREGHQPDLPSASFPGSKWSVLGIVASLNRGWLSTIFLTIVMFGGLVFLSTQSRRLFGLPDFAVAEKYFLEGDYDRAVAEYTAIINRHPDALSAASEFNKRGLSYRGKNDIPSAIADFDEAIRRRPDFPEAYFNRCDALQRKTNIDRALADCQEAAKLNADYQEPRQLVVQMLLERGDIESARTKIDELIELRARSKLNTLDYRFYRGQILLFYDNQPAAAIADFAVVLANAVDYRTVGKILGPQNIAGVPVADLMAYQHAFVPDAYYTVLWLRIARARANKTYATQFEDDIAVLGRPIERKLSLQDTSNDVIDEALQPWPGPLIAFYLGKKTPEVIRKGIEQISDPAVRKHYSCDTDFYLGEFAYEKQAFNEAKNLFQSAAKDCPRSALEAGFAKAELQRLEALSPK